MNEIADDTAINSFRTFHFRAFRPSVSGITQQMSITLIRNRFLKASNINDLHFYVRCGIMCFNCNDDEYRQIRYCSTLQRHKNRYYHLLFHECHRGRFRFTLPAHIVQFVPTPGLFICATETRKYVYEGGPIST